MSHHTEEDSERLEEAIRHVMKYIDALAQSGFTCPECFIMSILGNCTKMLIDNDIPLDEITAKLEECGLEQNYTIH